METLRARIAGGAAAAAVVAIALAAWTPGLDGGFRHDDYGNVLHDRATRDAPALLERLPRGVRPLTRASFFLNHQLWGFSPRAFLATNLALHLVASLLVLALARRRLGSVVAGALAGAIFAAQPAHDVVVSYVSGRSAALSTALLLAGLLVWDRAGGRRAGTWGAAALFFAASLARETALVFPLIVLLWEATRSTPQASLRRRLAPLMPPVWVAATFALALCSISTRYRELAATSLALHPPPDALAENLSALPIALSLWLRPGALSIEHPPPPAGPLWIAAGALLASGLVVAAVAFRRRAPELALAAGWVAVALLPTHTLLARAEPVTQRPLYLAWIGPALLGAAAASAFARHLPSRRVASAAVAVAVPLLLLATGLVASHRRARLWSDEPALWRAAVARAPESPRAWNNLGAAYVAAREPARAREAFRGALAIDPSYPPSRAGLAGLALASGGLSKGDASP